MKGDGFLKLLKVLEPKYHLPSPQTLKRNYLDTVYNEIKNEVRTIVLTNCISMSLTSDYWTCSVQNNSYIAFTLHLITRDFEQYHFLLKFEEDNESHTAMQIS